MPPSHVCPICQETLTIQCSAATLPCGHVSHESCLLKWFSTSQCCPLCRATAKRAHVVKLFYSSDDSSFNSSVLDSDDDSSFNTSVLDSDDDDLEYHMTALRKIIADKVESDRRLAELKENLWEAEKAELLTMNAVLKKNIEASKQEYSNLQMAFSLLQSKYAHQQVIVRDFIVKNKRLSSSHVECPERDLDATNKQMQSASFATPDEGLRETAAKHESPVDSTPNDLPAKKPKSILRMSSEDLVSNSNDNFIIDLATPDARRTPKNALPRTLRDSCVQQGLARSTDNILQSLNVEEEKKKREAVQAPLLEFATPRL